MVITQWLAVRYSLCLCTQRALAAQRKLKKEHEDLEVRLCDYFKRSTVVETSAPAGKSNVGIAPITRPRPTAMSSAEPDGPDMQQQYKTLFGLFFISRWTNFLRQN